MRSLSTLLAGALGGEPGRPVLTCYDDATGERVELSAATSANWVAKAANLLVGDLDVAPGEKVALLVPPHWQSAVLLLSCWSVGAVAVLGPDEEAAVAFAAGDRLGEATAAGSVVALSLLPMGAPLPAPPPAGVLDLARELPGQPDAPPSLPGPPADAPALEVAGAAHSRAEVAAAVAAVGLGAGERVLSLPAWDRLEALAAGLLAPVCLGGGAVLCVRPDPAVLAARASQERVTATVGVSLPGLRRLG